MVEKTNKAPEESANPPDARYTKTITKPGIGIDDITNAINRKIRMDQAGITESQQDSLKKFISEFNLPDEALFEFFEFEDGRIIRNGDLEAVFVEALSALPDNMTVRGNVLLMSLKNLKQLPQGLFVDGNIVIVNTLLEKLPSDIKAETLALPKKCSKSLRQKAEILLQRAFIKTLKFI